MKHLMYQGRHKGGKAMLKRLIKILSYRKQFVSLLVGVPSYDTYVAHMRMHHPEDPVKTIKNFSVKPMMSGITQRVGKCLVAVNDIFLKRVLNRRPFFNGIF